MSQNPAPREPDQAATAVSDLVRHASEMIRAEAALVRDEFVDEARRARRSVTLLLIGAVATHCGVLLLALVLPAALGASETEVAVIAALVLTAGVVTTLFAWRDVTRPPFARARGRLTNEYGLEKSEAPSEEIKQ